MHNKAMVQSAVILLGLTGHGFAADTTPADETAAVEQALGQFYTSLNALLAGDARSMDDVWSHADDVTYMGPIGGIAVGWDQVRAGWNVQADMQLGGHVEPLDRHVTIGNDVAIVEGYELGSGGDGDGLSRPFRIRATSSFRKEDGQWKMIGHHTDMFNSNSDSDTPSNRQPETSSNGQASASSNDETGANSDDDSIDVSGDEVILKLER